MVLHTQHCLDYQQINTQLRTDQISSCSDGPHLCAVSDFSNLLCWWDRFVPIENQKQCQDTNVQESTYYHYTLLMCFQHTCFIHVCVHNTPTTSLFKNAEFLSWGIRMIYVVNQAKRCESHQQPRLYCCCSLLFPWGNLPAALWSIPS